MIFESIITLGYFGVFLLVVALNLIPFTSPSNLVLAGVIVYFTDMHPAAIAIIVAIGATLSKFCHFYLSTFLGKRFNHKKTKLGKYSRILGRWKTLGTFIAAASPIPDDPVVIPLGLMRFDALKFIIAYFVGKIMITFLGAYGVKVVEVRIETLLGDKTTFIASIILSILAITVLYKIDPSKIREYLSKIGRYMGIKH